VRLVPQGERGGRELGVTFHPCPPAHAAWVVDAGPVDRRLEGGSALLVLLGTDLEQDVLADTQPDLTIFVGTQP
jgi:hypothetical protein